MTDSMITGLLVIGGYITIVHLLAIKGFFHWLRDECL